MSSQQLERLVGIPAGFPEFHGMETILRETTQKALEALDVPGPARRQLIEHGTKVRSQMPSSREEPGKRVFRIFQFLHMRQISTALHREHKAAGHTPLPCPESFALRE